jgi:hypothetical protein
LRKLTVILHPDLAIELMRKILSERNIAGLLFVMVIIAFSFAHEDSKKRSLNYNVSTHSVSPENPSSPLSANTQKKSDIILVKGD